MRSNLSFLRPGSIESMSRQGALFDLQLTLRSKGILLIKRR